MFEFDPSLPVPTGLLVGGRWVAGAERIEVDDPATGEVIAEAHAAGPEHARQAVDAAAAAAGEWARTPPRQRGEVLRRTFELMTERAEALARLIVAENGKSLADARGEVAYAAEFFRWYAEEAVRVPGRLATAPGGGNRIAVLHQPVGVCLLITPWNFPAAMATRKIAPALAAGCTVVLKPASETPLTALVIGALVEEAGAPPGVVNVLPARDAGALTSAVLADERVRKLSFTGSTRVGRLLLAQAAERVLNVSMELGGNAPFVVHADADLEAAVEGALVAKLRNGGQACTAANRFYVHEAVAESFGELFCRAMAALRLGPGRDPDAQIGPLVSARAREGVHELVAAAVDGGARLELGGQVPDRPGWFYPPTLLADVPADAPILREEIFGPVAPLVTFGDEDEMLRLANGTGYGLTAYVYTRDLARGLRTAEALEAGMVGVNRGMVSDPAAPFGGIKQSGLGREGGQEGLLAFLEPKYVALDW